jgi:hypothetical protein
VKNVLLVVNSEKNALAVTENVPSIEETTIPVEEMTKNEPTGFVHPVETIISLSELSAIVVENQSEVTFRNVAALSETIVADVEMTVADVEMTVADVTTEDLAIKNNIIEMTGFVLHVRTTTSHSELNVTNVENLDREETLEEGIPVEDVEATEEVATAADETVTVEDVEATEEVATAADETVIVEDVEATEEVVTAADEMVTVEDVEATEEVAPVADEMVTNVENLDREETLEEGIPVEDVEATEEVASAADETVTEEVAPVADETVIVEDVEATEEVATAADETVTVEDVEEMTVQMNNIERLVENDQVMLTIDHLKKSSPVDINDAMTMTIKVKI